MSTFEPYAVDFRGPQYAQLITLMRAGYDQVAQKFWATMPDDHVAAAAVEALTINNLSMVQFFLKHAHSMSNPLTHPNMVSQLGHLAVGRNNTEALNVLLPVANISLQCGLLTEACQRGNLKVVQAIVNCGVDPRHSGDYPLQMAASNGHLEVVEELLKDVPVHSLNNKFIDSAAKCGHVAVVERLLQFTAHNSCFSALIAGNQHQNVVDLLYPLCSPGDLVLYLEWDKASPTERVDYVRTRWEAEQIEQSLPKEAGICVKPKKM